MLLLLSSVYLYFHHLDSKFLLFLEKKKIGLIWVQTATRLLLLLILYPHPLPVTNVTVTKLDDRPCRHQSGGSKREMMDRF